MYPHIFCAVCTIAGSHVVFNRNAWCDCLFHLSQLGVLAKISLCKHCKLAATCICLKLSPRWRTRAMSPNRQHRGSTAVGPLAPIQTSFFLFGPPNIPDRGGQPWAIPKISHQFPLSRRRAIPRGANWRLILAQTFSSQMWPIDSPVQGGGSGFALSHSVPPNTCVFGQIRWPRRSPSAERGRKASPASL